MAVKLIITNNYMATCTAFPLQMIVSKHYYEFQSQLLEKQVHLRDCFADRTSLVWLDARERYKPKQILLFTTSKTRLWFLAVRWTSCMPPCPAQVWLSIQFPILCVLGTISPEVKRFVNLSIHLYLAYAGNRNTQFACSPVPYVLI
jgi:hypothetical protein